MQTKYSRPISDIFDAVQKNGVGENGSAGKPHGSVESIEMWITFIPHIRCGVYALHSSQNVPIIA